MKEATRRALNALNRTFYEQRGAAFDATRDHPWPGWTRVLRFVEPRPEGAAPLRVLDVGCGNGRFGHFLMHRLAGPVEYLGIDASPPLLERARRTLRDARRDFFVQLAEQDLLEGRGPEGIVPGPFDLVVLFGVLHHVPGDAERHRLVAALADRLDVGGLLVLTAWQFGERERFVRTTVDAAEVAARARELGFDVGDLEPGDHLLGFGGDDTVPRFCHFTSEAELDALTTGLGLDERARFRDDGKSADLNAYRVLKRTA